jgi:Skp family chaperone for outer membrane proteins
MKIMLKAALSAGLALAAIGSVAVSAPAFAQAEQKIAFVNPPAVMVNSAAFQAAQTQRQTTYAAQIQQAETRRAALQAQLTPMVDAFNAARQQPNADQAALQQQAGQIQGMQQQGQAELQQMLAPVALSQAYVEEQLQDQLGAAIQAAAAAQGVSLVLNSEVVLHGDAMHNLNEAVLAQLNTLLPSAQIVPPQGWLPRELREEQAAAGGAPAAEQPAATSGR